MYFVLCYAFAALFAWLARPVWCRGGGLALIGPAVLWVAVEWLRAHLLSGFPWNLAAYAWVDLPEEEEEFLNERLVDKGLARIHTKGAPVPDGRTSREYESHLEGLEAAAKAADRGAWGLD